MTTQNGINLGLSGATGSGTFVGATSPTLVTPVLGVATATSLNGATITSTNGTLTLANGSSLITSGANPITLTSSGTTNVTLPTSGTLLSDASMAIPKAWVYFTNSGSPTIVASYNVSSIEAVTTGQVKVNLTVPFASTNYCVIASGDTDFPGASASQPNAAYFYVYTGTYGSQLDGPANAVAFGQQ